MTQEEKQLLLVDLCARLPYGICANLPNHHLVSHKYYIHECNVKNGWTTGILNCAGREGYYSAEIEDIQPYLRPLSSMTEEESAELSNIISEWFDKELFYLTEEPFLEYALSRINYTISPLLFDWLNAHHFDFRNLLAKGLAIEVTEEFNPYKD